MLGFRVKWGRGRNHNMEILVVERSTAAGKMVRTKDLRMDRMGSK